MSPLKAFYLPMTNETRRNHKATEGKRGMDKIAKKRTNEDLKYEK